MLRLKLLCNGESSYAAVKGEARSATITMTLRGGESAYGTVKEAALR